jgi:pimeloyl-ACP methyl ester carboxylesterase
MVTAEPRAFNVDIPQHDLDDLRDRLRRTRWPADFGNDDWRFGTPERYLRELVGHWADRFDWRAQEAAMNGFEHWRVAIDGVPIHYVLEQGQGPAPLPVILTHGWPWTFWDYRHVIRPLADPTSHGGDAADAFTVIVPSLPGYVFSTPFATPDVGFTQTADLWHRLMTEVLGFDAYGAGGGDWGAFVTAHLAHVAPPELVGAYLTFPALLDFDFTALTPDAYSDEERAAGWFEQSMVGSASGHAHMAVHIGDPQSLAYGLTDSPTGLAGWMVKRRRAWSDCGGDVESRFSKDDLLTSFSLYWLTNSFGSAIRMYSSSFRAPWTPVHDRTPALQAPVGIGVFPKELALLPRRAAEQHANLVHWTVMPRGGHFAAAEEPELFVEDLRAFFRPLRP